jgi:ABC-type lipoprotein export system ATPase subunit
MVISENPALAMAFDCELEEILSQNRLRQDASMIGSTWAKWDLHIHSPLTHLANRYECDLDSFANAVKEHELKVIGVTNYWCFKDQELEQVREALARAGADAIVLGNVEFRVAQPNKQGDWINVHCIFGEHVSTEQINTSLARIKVHNTTPGGKAVYCSEESLISSGVGYEGAVIELKTLCDGLSESLTPGKDYLIAICPNGYGGFRPDINEGRSRSVADEIYKKGQVVLGRPEDREFFLGDAIPNSVPKPVFYCSDAHTLKDIGTKYSWVKAKPGFRGLTQVLYEPADRVQQTSSFVELQLEKPYFKSIMIEGEIFSGQDIKFKRQLIPLNPNMVAIIGGRGTGKSLFLDSMYSRLGMCQGTDRVRGVSVEGLSISLSKGGSETLLFDSGSVSPYEYLHVSQGDIHRFAQNPTILSAEIKRMLGIRQKEFDSALQQELSENFSHYRAFISFWEETDATGARVNSPDYQKQIIGSNSQLISTLTNPQNAALIQQYQENNKLLNEQQSISSRSTELRTYIERTFASVNEQIRTYNVSAISANGVQQIPLLSHEATSSAIMSNVLRADALAGELLAQNEIIKQDFIRKGVRQDISSLLGKVQEYQLSIDEGNSKLALIEEKTASYWAGVKRRGELASNYNLYLEAFRSEIDIAYSALLQPNQSWNAEQNDLVQSMLKDIELRGQIVFDIDKFYSGLEGCVNRGKFRSSGERSTQDKLREMFRLSTKEDFFRLVVGHPVMLIEGEECKLEEFCWKSEYFNQGGRYELLDYLFSANKIKDYLYVNAEFTYKGKTVEKLSVGQRGTFYVCLKLATDPFGSPFVFDQPEDDLDNGFIMGQLVPLFKVIKKYRQVIIVTHNANLVVNSDAEQVIVAFNNGEIVSYVSGALEDGDVRGGGIKSLVCSILEGGHTAFEQRERKYGIWTSSAQ